MESFLEKRSVKRRELRTAKKQRVINKGVVGKERETSRQELRYIPAKVRAAVLARDGYSCAFLSANGRRCGARHDLEIHHVIPFALGGTPSLENLSARCRVHNYFEAEHDFGKAFMREKVGTPCENSL